CVPCAGQPLDDPDNFCGYTAEDNSYEVIPQTCVVREYFFEIQNTTISPDGIERIALVVNGQMPGPAITANWGDTIVLHVTNSLQNNGSTIHMHGLRQNYTNEFDGVPSITQCPIAPGESMTYTFRATNYGTSWWHSHFSLQAYEGVFGPLIINGPSHIEQTYTDDQTIVLQDWTHVPVNAMFDAAEDVGPLPQNGPRTVDGGLINGMNVWGQDGAAGTTGERWQMSVTAGQTYRLRIINSAIQSTFVFGIDGHELTVIAADFVPIVPYTTNTIIMTNGQRYDVLVTFNQAPGNYWMRSDSQQLCGSMTAWNNVMAIVNYDTVTPAVPTSTAHSYVAGCYDEPMASLVPYVALNAGTQQDQISESVSIGAAGGTPNLYKWTLNGVFFQGAWAEPTLVSLVENNTIPTVSGDLAIQVPDLGEWVYVVIESPFIGVPHPIHLHGHDFYILGQGVGSYDSSVALNLVNPPRRDVAVMPIASDASQGGYLVIAYITDNPGVWLLHCHIGWHVAMGFALQIIENMENIASTVTDSCLMQDTCTAWDSYAVANNDVDTTDSGV
ncbi:hypothetical protein BAUCODRAFT_57035, partial [Baudoinia panamericana UAMH 10762]